MWSAAWKLYTMPLVKTYPRVHPVSGWRVTDRNPSHLLTLHIPVTPFSFAGLGTLDFSGKPTHGPFFYNRTCACFGALLLILPSGAAELDVPRIDLVYQFIAL